MDSIKILLATIGSSIEIGFGIFYFYLIRNYFNIGIVGHYGVITSFFLTFNFIIDLGFSLAHLKFFPELKNSEEEAIHNGTFLFIKLIQFLCFIIVIIILIPIIPLYDGNVIVVYLLFFATILRIGKTFFHPIFYSKKQVIKINIAILSSELLKTLLLITLINWVNPDIEFLILILFISNFIYLSLNIIFIRGLKVKRFKLEILKKYFKYAAPFFIVTSLSYILINIDILVLNIWYPVEEVANYFTAKQIYRFLTIFTVSFLNILITTFSFNIYSNNNQKNFKLIKEIHRVLNFFLVPIAFLITLYSKDLLIFIFGENYALTSVLITILSFNLISISLDIGNNIYLRALGEVFFIVKISIFKTILTIILMIFFISPDFFGLGSIGAALAFILGELIIFVITRYILYRKYQLTFYWGCFRNIIIMLSIFIFQLYLNVLFSFSIISIFLFPILDIGLYIFLNYIFKGFNKKDIRLLLKIIKIKNIKNQVLEELKNSKL